MAVSTTDTYSGPYEANGATVEFPFTFKAIVPDELIVLLISASGDEAIVAPELYSVTVLDQSGSITFGTAPVSGQLYILSEPAFSQQVNFASGQPFLPTVINTVNDRAVIRDLYLKRETERGIRFPVGEEGVALPRASTRAGKAFAFDANGDPVAAALPNGSVLVDLSPVISTAGQAAFTFEGLDDNLAEVKVNGVTLPTDAYTVSADTITFVTPRAEGDYVLPRVVGGWSTALRTPLATPFAPGLMTQTDKIKSDGIVDMKSIGARFNSDYDNAQRFIDAVAELPRGGVINLGHYGNLYTSADIELPPNVHVKGEWHPQKPRLSWNYLDTCPSTIILEPNRTVNMNGAKVENVLFWQANINQNPTSEAAFYNELAKFDGNAITATGDDPACHQCMFIGFERAALIYNVFRPEFTENVFDCLGGFDVSAVYDFRGRGISNNLGQAVYIQYRPWPIAVTRRPGKAIYVHDVADGVTVKDNKSYGYQCGLHLKDVFEVKASHIADGPGLPDPAAAAGTRGIWLQGNLNGCNITDSGAHGQETGWYIDATGITQMGNNTCGVAVLNQIYFGPGSRGNLGNMLIGGTCNTPIAAAAGVGEWAGSIDCWSTATSGKMFFLFNLAADKNKFRDVRRRYFDTTIYDPLPNFGVGEYTFATKPASAPVGTRIRVTDAGNAPTAFGATLAGGGSNIVEAVYLGGGWRVG